MNSKMLSKFNDIQTYSDIIITNKEWQFCNKQDFYEKVVANSKKYPTQCFRQYRATYVPDNITDTQRGEFCEVIGEGGGYCTQRVFYHALDGRKYYIFSTESEDKISFSAQELDDFPTSYDPYTRYDNNVGALHPFASKDAHASIDEFVNAFTVDFAKANTNEFSCVVAKTFTGVVVAKIVSAHESANKITVITASAFKTAIEIANKFTNKFAIAFVSATSNASTSAILPASVTSNAFATSNASTASNASATSNAILPASATSNASTSATAILPAFAFTTSHAFANAFASAFANAFTSAYASASVFETSHAYENAFTSVCKDAIAFTNAFITSVASAIEPV